MTLAAPAMLPLPPRVAPPATLTAPRSARAAERAVDQQRAGADVGRAGVRVGAGQCQGAGAGLGQGEDLAVGAVLDRGGRLGRNRLVDRKGGGAGPGAVVGDRPARAGQGRQGRGSEAVEVQAPAVSVTPPKPRATRVAQLQRAAADRSFARVAVTVAVIAREGECAGAGLHQRQFGGCRAVPGPIVDLAGIRRRRVVVAHGQRGGGRRIVVDLAQRAGQRTDRVIDTVQPKSAAVVSDHVGRVGAEGAGRSGDQRAVAHVERGRARVRVVSGEDHVRLSVGEGQAIGAGQVAGDLKGSLGNCAYAAAADRDGGRHVERQRAADLDRAAILVDAELEIGVDHHGVEDLAARMIRGRAAVRTDNPAGCPDGQRARAQRRRLDSADGADAGSREPQNGVSRVDGHAPSERVGAGQKKRAVLIVQDPAGVAGIGVAHGAAERGLDPAGDRVHAWGQCGRPFEEEGLRTSPAQVRAVAPFLNSKAL